MPLAHEPHTPAHQPPRLPLETRRRQALGLLLAAAPAAFVGCAAAPDVGDYAQERPAFDLATYFNGTVDGWGIFTDRSGRVVRRFVVTMACTWTARPAASEKTTAIAIRSARRRVTELAS